MTLPQTESLRFRERDGVPVVVFPALEAVPFVRHGFSTRLGGVSQGIYASMNLSFTRGDDPCAVRENFDRFCSAVGVLADRVVVSAQEHHTTIYNATAADCGRGITRDRGYEDVDGLLTDEPGVVLCTQYADCVPLFFVDPVRRVVGTSHSGWKGTVAQIGAVTVERMCADYGCRRQDILAGIGPSIGPCCFEVDAPVNRRILEKAGLRPEHITATDLCTKCHADVFWSHRVTGGQRGSLAGFIAMEF